MKIENKLQECFVKTVALDGERNLKPKVQCKYLADNFENLFDPASTETKPRMHVQTVKPIKDLYSYKGQMHFDINGESKVVNIDLNSFLHRGSFLENS